jgi:intracellular multiplication protein IcmJ
MKQYDKANQPAPASSLLPLLISVRRDDGAADSAAPAAGPNGTCSFCGASLGLHAEAGCCCAACILVRHLERPRIDDEAGLVWLPEMSQAALVCLVREIHGQLRVAGESLYDSSAVLSAAALYYARSALDGRAALAAEYLGTDRPSELAHVLGRMPRAIYARRHRLLGGLRVLPAGHFFVGTADVYPAVVDSWLGAGDADSACREAA